MIVRKLPGGMACLHSFRPTRPRASGGTPHDTHGATLERLRANVATLEQSAARANEAAARAALARWKRMDASDLPRSEIVRHVIEHSVLSAHRHVFGVFVWYSILAALGLGPAGAVFYRVSEYLSVFAKRSPRPELPPVSEQVRERALRAWELIDWLPARVTALSFAFVGSFEDAVDSWRQQAAAHPLDNDGGVLAATAGAVNVRLGEDGVLNSDAMTPEPAHLRAVVGLVWRTVLMWMVFLALLSLARLIG